MKDKLLKLGRHSLVYGLGNALSVAGGFLLIPLYTHVLSTEEYGILELLNRTADISMLVMFNGVRQAFIRYYFDRDDIEWHKTVVASTLVFIVTACITIALIFFVFRGLLADALFKDAASGLLFVFMAAWLPFESLVRVGMTHLQIQMKSVKYVSINFVKLVLVIISNIILVYVYRKGIIGVLVTNIWVSAFIGLCFMSFFIKWSHLKISFRLIKDLLKFGLPYLPTACFMFIINSSDRYFLSSYSSLDSVGIYALAYKIGMFGISLLMGPFGKVWPPFLFENYNNKDGPELISKVFTLYTLVSVSVGLAISVASPIIIPLISGQAFHSAYKIVPFICLASIFYGMATLADAGILISKKTGYKPLIFGPASIISVVLNLILIPKYGVFGASITLALTFLTLLILNHIVANKFYTLKIEYKKIFLIFSSASTVYLFSLYFLTLGDQMMHTTLYSILSLFIFPAILWLGRFFSDNEKLIVKRLLTKRAV